MNLVVGATGLLGGAICTNLAAAKRPVTALVRSSSDESKRGALEDAGIRLVEGDLKDRDSLDEACRGVDSVISTASSTFSRQEGDSIQSVDLDGQCALIEAAKAASIKRFVFISFRDDPTIQYPLSRAKREAEQRLIASGMGYTILQASNFMEIWLSAALGFDFQSGKVKIYGIGENRISWISFLDVAKFAVASIDHSYAANAIIPLGGPEALSPLEVVAIFEEIASRPFVVENTPETDLENMKSQAPDPLQESFCGLMIQYAHGDEIDMRETLRAMPLQMTSVRDFASQVLG